MGNTELLQMLVSGITSEMRQQFEKEFMIENKCFSNLRSYYVQYLKELGESNTVNNWKNYLEVLKNRGLILNYSDLNDDELYKVGDLAICNLYRFESLKNHGEFKSYEDKLHFVLKEAKDYFNFFRTYIIPNYGDFTVFPSNEYEVGTFVKFLKENFKKNGRYSNLYDSNENHLKF